MSAITLHDKLRRLRRADGLLPEPRFAPSAPSPAPPPSLGRLEETLFGAASEDGVPLRERLMRLVAVAERRDRGRDRAADFGAERPDSRADRRSGLEEIVQGMRVENERGEFFRMENEIHLESFHGDVTLSRFHTLSPTTVGVLTAEESLARFDLRQAVFLDTETTGLAGGAGTAAFLVGVGFVDGDRFRVRQYFMRDYHEEGALLFALAQDLERFESIVTFNGKMFDLPLLEARFRLNRTRFPLAAVPHFDVLHPARRLWKARLDSCRLQNLEAELLGLRRLGDIPGEMIPQAYFDFVRRRDARAMKRIFDHNRQDIVSLAAVAILACQWVEEEGRAEDPRDVVSLGRVLERAHLYERSDVLYRRALALADGPARVQALMRLALRARHAGDFAAARELWEQAAEAGEPEAFRALAVHHEHRTRDLGAALNAAESGIRLLDRTEARQRRLGDGFARRRERILRKMASEGGEPREL